jgi:hypothetical protein
MSELLDFEERIFIKQDIDAANEYSKTLYEDFLLIKNIFSQNEQNIVNLIHLKLEEEKSNYFRIMNGFLYIFLVNILNNSISEEKLFSHLININNDFFNYFSNNILFLLKKWNCLLEDVKYNVFIFFFCFLFFTFLNSLFYF